MSTILEIRTNPIADAELKQLQPEWAASVKEALKLLPDLIRQKRFTKVMGCFGIGIENCFTLSLFVSNEVLEINTILPQSSYYLHH